MSLRPEPLLPIPDATAAAVRAAFPKGNLYVDLRAEFGMLYDDQLFTDLYPPESRPVEVAYWRLALVVVMQYEAQQAPCPQGHASVNWRPGHDVSVDPVIRSQFDRDTCRACSARQACTAAKNAPRQLTVRTQAHHEAIQAARQWQETAEFTAPSALRAEVESSLSQGIRRFDLRQSRYLGLARTHLQQLLNATAINVVRVVAWLRGEPLRERRRKPGHFASLAPHPLSRQAVLC
jgi:hypothetical protein